jgi:protein-tyrosine phosphatase
MKVLMVCLGNICRSPMAEGILRKKAAEKHIDLWVDSAGTGNWHSGENPDPRAVETAKKFGVNISKLVARQFSKKDFEEFDKIFAMDTSNYNDILALANNPSDKAKVDLLLNLLPDRPSKDVPDPWYGEKEDFVEVFQLLDEVCEIYIQQL